MLCKVTKFSGDMQIFLLKNNVLTFAAYEVLYEVSMRFLKDTSCSKTPVYKGVSEDYMRL